MQLCRRHIDDEVPYLVIANRARRRFLGAEEGFAALAGELEYLRACVRRDFRADMIGEPPASLCERLRCDLLQVGGNLAPVAAAACRCKNGSGLSNAAAQVRPLN